MPGPERLPAWMRTRRFRVGGALALAAVLLAGVLLWDRADEEPAHQVGTGTTEQPAAGSGDHDGSTTSTAATASGGEPTGTTGATAPATTAATAARAAPAGAAPVGGAPACDASTEPAGADTVVRIDTRAQLQPIDGFGTSVRIFDDPHVTETFSPATNRGAVVVPPGEQDAILDRLYRDLKLTRVRPTTEGGVEPANDNADPAVTDASRLNFEWKRNDDHVAYYARAARRGASTVFLSPVSLESWMTSVSPAEYVEWAMAVIRRWKSLGVELPYYSVANEPGGTINLSGEFIRDVIRLLGPKLRAEGFATRILVPDDINPAEAYERLAIVMADAAARQYVGAVAYHLYGDLGPRSEILRLADQYGLPVWMTEYYQGDAFEWANTVHELLDSYGVRAVDYLWGFFGQWRTDGDALVTIRHEGDRYTGYTLNKQYYTFGQYTRFVAPGSRRVAVSGGDHSVRVTAFVKDGRTTVVAINNADRPWSTRFALAGGPCAGSAAAVRTSFTEDWRELPAAPVDSGAFTAPLAPRSVTTFVVAPR